MSKEQPLPHEHHPFDFTERERLFDRISHERLLALLKDERTTIHRAELSTNSFGEFLFVTASRKAAAQESVVTFFGLGYHEYRERWLTDEWFWYESHSYPQALAQHPARGDVLQTISERRAEVQFYAARQVQSERGKLFDVIADLTDDDGAISDFEDFADGLDDFE